MNIIYKLISIFFEKEWFNTTVLVVINICLNLVQTNAIPLVTAKIINTIKSSSFNSIQVLMWIFIGLSISYLFLIYYYRTYKYKLLTKLHQWIRSQLVKMILVSNNENFSNENFIKMNSPINHMASICHMMVSDTLTFITPTFIFLFVIACYLFYINPFFGLMFTLSNMLILVFLYFTWETTMIKNNEYQKNVTDNEFYLLEILNNIDKIIYRGQTKNEIEIFNEKGEKTVKTAFSFFNYTNMNGIFMNCIVYTIMFLFIFYSIYLFKNKQMNLEQFITLFSIIILYRDKMATFIQQVPDIIEFLGRTDSIVKEFENIEIDHNYSEKIYSSINIPFETIEFKNVSFKYKSGTTNVFENLNLKLDTTKHRIIGMTGLSGRGKSSLAKLVLKMYKHYQGDIFIDGVNIRDIDANYIRENITYINQNSKLFDRLIIDNMMYGCIRDEICFSKIAEILKEYPKISELFKDIDIYKKTTGPLGENLSGGQRQIVNIVGGLVNPTKILILDEPTNALDVGLKSELLRLIYDNKQNKQCILIITHDKDVHGILNEKIAI